MGSGPIAPQQIQAWKLYNPAPLNPLYQTPGTPDPSAQSDPSQGGQPSQSQPAAAPPSAPPAPASTASPTGSAAPSSTQATLFGNAPSATGAAALYGQQPPAASLDDYIAQHGHAPIEGAPPAVPQHGTLYKVFNTIGRVLGSPMAQQAWQRDYDLKQQNIGYQRNQPVMQRQADEQAYNEATNISHTQAQTHLENVQADIASQNLPVQEATQKYYQQLTDAWQNKSVPDFDTYAHTFLQGLPPQMARMIVAKAGPQLQGIKQLPQTGKGYSINMQDDVPTSVNVYGKDYSRNDPALAKLPDGPAAIADFDRAQAAHQTKRSEKLSDEETASGFASERQAAGFQHAADMKATEQIQPRINTALDANERLSRMESSYEKAKNGDQQAMLALLADHIGMTFGLQKNVRANKALIAEAQQSQPWLQGIAAKFDDNGYLSGATLGQEQMRQMLDLGYRARDQAFQSAHEAATTYGQALPAGFAKVEAQRPVGSRPALDGGNQGTQPPKGATHTGVGSVDKKKHYLDANGKDLGLAE